MEEIASTEALEREILEDARRKAARALRLADEAAARSLVLGEERLAKAITDLELSSSARVAARISEARARLPLEKSRLRTARIDGLVRDSLAAYLEGLPEAFVASFAEERLREAAPFLAGKELRVAREGLSEERARAAILRSVPGATIAEIRDATTASIAAAAEEAKAEDARDLSSGPLDSAGKRGLTAFAVDGSVSLRATLDLAAEAILYGALSELVGCLCAEPEQAESRAEGSVR